MKFRRTASTTMAALVTAGACALVLVAVIGSAQAAPSTKLYTANVRLANAATSQRVFRVELANDATSQQGIGSANFTSPFSIQAETQPVTTENGHHWTVTSNGTGLVTLRANSNGDAVAPGQRVFANVTTTAVPPTTCASAVWTIQAKQSNDFSGKGNDTQSLPASDLTPLRSFDIPLIGTTVGTTFVPSVALDDPASVPFDSTATAKDTCGHNKTNYTGAGATLSHTKLSGADFDPDSGLDWSGGGGIGTVSVTPVVTEVLNSLTVTDSTTGVTSSSNTFTVVDTLCTSTTSTCTWHDNQGIRADASTPPANASLGVGFNPDLPFNCNTDTDPLGTVVEIDPNGPLGPYTVSLTYPKAISGTGPASNFTFCISKNNGATWNAISACLHSPPVLGDGPCVQTQKRTTNGDLLIILFFDSKEDPLGGVK